MYTQHFYTVLSCDYMFVPGSRKIPVFYDSLVQTCMLLLVPFAVSGQFTNTQIGEENARLKVTVQSYLIFVCIPEQTCLNLKNPFAFP